MEIRTRDPWADRQRESLRNIAEHSTHASVSNAVEHLRLCEFVQDSMMHPTTSEAA